MRSSASTFFSGFFFLANASWTVFATACCAITSTSGLRVVDGRLLLLSPIDFVVTDVAGAPALLLALLVAGFAGLAELAGVRVFDPVTKGFLLNAVAAVFIAFALPVVATFAFEAVGFLLEVIGVFFGAFFLMARFAVALVAEDEVPRFLDAVAMEVSVAGA